MALGVQVILEPQIILDIIDFRNFSQVTIFKPAVKYKDILLLRDVNFKLRVRKISLGRKSRQVPEKVPVLVRSKISLPCFLGKAIPICLFDLILRKKYIMVHFLISPLFKIRDYFFTAGKFGIRVINYNPVHLLSSHWHVWGLGFLEALVVFGVGSRVLGRGTSHDIGTLVNRAHFTHVYLIIALSTAGVSFYQLRTLF